MQQFADMGSEYARCLILSGDPLEPPARTISSSPCSSCSSSSIIAHTVWGGEYAMRSAQQSQDIYNRAEALSKRRGKKGEMEELLKTHGLRFVKVRTPQSTNQFLVY